jgi:hypothetical protein
MSILRPQQTKFITDLTSPFSDMIGGNRSGKTYGGAEKAILFTIINGSHSKTQGLAIEPTYNMAIQLLKPKIDLIAESYKLPFVWKEHKKTFIFSSLNNSEILLKSAERPERIEGGQYSWIWIDEPAQCKPAIWNRIITRLNDKNALIKQIFTTGTPEGLNWYHKEINKIDENGNYIHNVIYGTEKEIELNAGTDHIKRLKANLDPLLLKEKLYGEFTNTTSGRVFYAFTKDCVIPRNEYQIKNYLDLIVSCDFNINPCIWNLHQIEDDTVYTFDEIALNNANTQFMCDKLTEWLQGKNISSIVFYGDYTSVYQRTTASSITDWNIIDNNFKNYFDYKKKLKPNPKVKDRVETQNSLLSHGRHKITSNCKNLIDDYHYIVWSSNGYELDKSNKERTHAADGTGYFLDYEFSINKKYSQIL